MQNSGQNDITKIVSNEINDKSIDLSIDYSEIALDAFIEDGVLKEIPIIKSVVAFYNIGSSLIARHQTKKILTFFKEFHSRTIDANKLADFKIKFNQDVDYKNQVIETIILLNERFLQVDKSKILAKLLIAHIEEHLSWQEFTDLSVVLDIIQPKGLIFLSKMSNEQDWANHGRDQVGEPLMSACGIGHRHGSLFMINKLGQDLYNFGVR